MTILTVKIANFSDEKMSNFDEIFFDRSNVQRPLSAAQLLSFETDVSKKLHKIRPMTAHKINPGSRVDKLEKTIGPLPDFLEAARPVSVAHLKDDVIHDTEILRKLNKTGHLATRQFNNKHIKIEEMISLPQLKVIKSKFDQFNGSINQKNFTEIVLTVLNLDPEFYFKHVNNLFMKIDTNADFIIDWDAFCSYMQIELQEKERVQLERNRVRFNLPAAKINTGSSNINYKDVSDIRAIAELKDGGFITASSEGVLLVFPRPSNNIPVPRKKIVVKRPAGIKIGKPENSEENSKKAVYDISFVSKYNKVIVSTWERELLVFDLGSGDLYATLEGLEGLPLKMKVECPDEQMYIVIGDSMGFISVIEIPNASECLRQWSKRVKTVKSNKLVEGESQSKSIEIKGVMSLDEMCKKEKLCKHRRLQLHDEDAISTLMEEMLSKK